MTMANRAAVQVAPPARAMPTWWWKEIPSTITISRILLIVSNQGDANSSVTNGVMAINNTVTNNDGIGLWADVGLNDGTFSGNAVIDNSGQGIRYEISHNGLISDNLVASNAFTTASCAYGPQIEVSNSDGVTIDSNVVVSHDATLPIGHGGIQISQDNNSSIITVHDHVTNNSITYAAPDGLTGGEDYRTPTTLFNPVNDNFFNFNQYQLNNSTPNSLHWMWNGSGVNQLDWSQWEAAGQDLNGNVSVP